MGIEFLAETEQQRAAVEGFLDFLVSQPGVAPELHCIPREFVPVTQLPHDNHASDALLGLLRNDSDLSRADFLAELKRQRGASAESAQPEAAAAANA
jgi:hypothetical protein